MSVDIKSIGLFRCRSDSESDVIQILREDDLARYQDVTRITQELIGRLIGKDFVAAKSARVHKFTDEASKPRDVDAISTRELLNDLVEKTDIEDNFETLAKWYHQADYAQSGLLIIAHFLNEGFPQVAIIKAPFMDDAYEPDDEEVLTKMDSVIKGDLKKGILYPRLTPDKEVREEEACVYQTKGSSKYAKHWYKYLHLEPSKTANEILDDEVTAEDGESPLEEAESTNDFEDIAEEVNENLGDAFVKVEIDNKTVKVRLSELLKREGVNLIETDDGYHLVLTGDEPTIKFFSGNKSEYQEILSGIDEYDNVNEVLL